MAQDNRIGSIVDPRTKPEIVDADLLSAYSLLFNADWGKKTLEDVRNIMSHASIIRHARAPADSDRVDNLTSIFYDTENQNTYFSLQGGHWQHQQTKNYRKQVYIGDFTKSTSAEALRYNIAGTVVLITAEEGTPSWYSVNEIRSRDVIFVGNKAFRTTSLTKGQIISNARTWNFSGAWQDSYLGLTFGSSESIYYSRYHAFVPDTLWEGTLYRSQTSDSDIQSLNAGKRFSDYDFINFEYNVNSSLLVPYKRFASNANRDVNLYTNDGVIWIRFVDDTRVRTVGGQGDSNMRLNRIQGYKVI